MKKYIVTIIILFIIIIFSICGYFVYANVKANYGNSIETLKEKAISEIEYLDAEITDILNGLNNISYTNYKLINEEITISNEVSGNEIQTSENSVDVSNTEYSGILDSNQDDVDWENLKEKTENIYSSWTTILIDLTTLDVDKENLLKFNDLLEEIISQEDEENKNDCLKSLAELYALLPTYLSDFYDDEQTINIYNVKSNIVNAYSLINVQNWNVANEYIESAKTEFNKIMNNQVNNINSIEEINKTYILINELSDDVSKESEKTFYINYQEIMEELGNI